MSIENSVKIVYPVDSSDPYRVLGVAMRDIGYDVGYICSNAHGKTNKWAMCKPVRHASPQELTAVQRRDVLYGLTRPLIYSANYNADSDWGYSPPSAGDCLRLLDFDGYRHDAVPGVRACGWPAYITVDQVVNIPRPTGGALDGCIPAEHLMSMRNSAGNAWIPMYWGVGYRFAGNDAWHVKTVDEPVSSATGQTVASFPLKVIDIPEWSQHAMASPTLYLCVFLSETRIADWTNTAQIIPLPKYGAEYRFHEYTGTGLRYYYSALYKAMNANGRGQTEYTRTDLLNARPITLYITFAQNPYSTRGAYAPGAGTRFKIRYRKYSYSNGNIIQSDLKERQFTAGDLQMTVDHTAKVTVSTLTVPYSDMLDESLKNANIYPDWPFEVWEYAQINNSGDMEWREITDYTAQPYLRYYGIH